VTTADKVLSVLALFSMERPEWTVEKAAGELDLAISTTYRYFRSLSRSGLLAALIPGRYVLGPAITQYDRQMRLLDPLVTTAQPVMKHLAALAPPHAVVLLCRLYRDHVMCVHQESAGQVDFAISYERGRPMSLFRGASSKIILAHMSSRTAKALYGRYSVEMRQAGLGANWEQIKTRLRVLRSAGAAVAHSELDVGMAGIAVPLFDPQRDVVGSISFVTPVRHMTQKYIATASQSLSKASEQINWGLCVLVSGHAGSSERKTTKLRQPQRGPKRPSASARRGRATPSV
jgi:DNA-binding IclR family transcriptional regulator